MCMRIAKKSLLVLLILLPMVVLMAASCQTSQEVQRQESINDRADMFARAEAKIPVPVTVNFPERALLAEYTKRQDLLNHPWYTYILSDNGTITAYFVSTTLPVSTSAFLSSTEDVSYGVVLSAPSLDGIYYGGAGGVTGNNGWIFIDAATGAMGVVYGANILTFDAPLILQTEPMLIQAQPVVK